MSVLDLYKREITKDDINRLPLRRYQGPIEMVRTKRQLKSALSRLKDEFILGFDTETKPSFRAGISYPPALLQLAGCDSVYLFQFNKIPFTEEIASILSDPGIIKTGVAVWDDIRGLQDLLYFEDESFVDLGDVSRELECSTNGLRNMAANFLGFRISKSMQASDWGKRDLSPAQITYAATDAWVSRELYICLKELELL